MADSKKTKCFKEHISSPAGSKSSKSKKKKMIAGSSIGAVVLVLALIFIVLGVRGGTDIAQLHVEEGDVQVDVGNGWVDAIDEMALSVSDKIKTLNGKAVLILYESIVVQIDPNTEISRQFEQEPIL